MGTYPPPVPLPTSGWGSTAPPVALSLRNPTIQKVGVFFYATKLRLFVFAPLTWLWPICSSPCRNQSALHLESVLHLAAINLLYIWLHSLVLACVRPSVSGSMTSVMIKSHRTEDVILNDSANCQCECRNSKGGAFIRPSLLYRFFNFRHCLLLQQLLQQINDSTLFPDKLPAVLDVDAFLCRSGNTPALKVVDDIIRHIIISIDIFYARESFCEVLFSAYWRERLYIC